MRELTRRISRAAFLSKNNPGVFGKVSLFIEKAITNLIKIVSVISAFTFLLTDRTSERFKLFDEVYLPYLLSVVAVAVVMRVIFKVADVLQRVPETRRRDVFQDWPYLRESLSVSSKLLADRLSWEGEIIGGSIEIFAHPANDGRLDDNGWDVTDVEIKADGRQFKVHPKLRSNKVIPGENGEKFCLVDYAVPFKDDSEKLRLFVKRTDWYTLMRAIDIVKDNIELRHSLSNLDPKKHQIPSSLCLHFVCLTADNNYLALKRSDATSFYPGTLSISFEEQMASSDFAAGEGRMRAWFLRAMCEEVLPLVGLHSRDPQAAEQIALQYIQFMRIWSCFFDETTGNFNLMGVAKLKLEAQELVATFDQLKRDHNTVRDIEGRMFIMSPDEVEGLLQSGHSTATSLIRPGEGALPITALHPSSLYRAARVASCLR